MQSSMTHESITALSYHLLPYKWEMSGESSAPFTTKILDIRIQLFPTETLILFSFSLFFP